MRCGEEGDEVGAQRSGNGPTRKPAALASLASRALTLPPTSTSSDPDETQYARSPSSPSFSTSVEAPKLAGTIESATRPRVASSLPSKGAQRESVAIMRFFVALSGARADRRRRGRRRAWQVQLEVCARARRKLVVAMDAVTSCFGLRWIGWDLSAANVGGHCDRGAHAALQRRELEPYPPELARGLLQLFSEPPPHHPALELPSYCRRIGGRHEGGAMLTWVSRIAGVP